MSKPKGVVEGQGDQAPDDASLLVGGLGEGDSPGASEVPPEGDGEPGGVTVKVAGQEFKVSPEVAAAMAAREAEYSRDFSKQGEELGALRRFKEESATQPSTGAEEEPDFNTQFFTDPKSALAELEERIVGRVSEAYTKTKAQDSFWKGFYKDNDDLKDADIIVKAVMSQKWASVKDMPLVDAKKTIADASREYLLKAVGKKAGKAPKNDTIVEGGSGLGGAGGKAKVDKGPQTLGEVIKGRQRARKASAVV